MTDQPREPRVEQWDLESVLVYHGKIASKYGFMGFKSVKERSYEYLSCYQSEEDNRTTVLMNGVAVTDMWELLKWFTKQEKVSAIVTFDDMSYGLTTKIDMTGIELAGTSLLESSHD